LKLERFILFLDTKGQDLDGLSVRVQLKCGEFGFLFGVEGEVIAGDDALAFDAESLAVNSFHYYIDSCTNSSNCRLTAASHKLMRIFGKQRKDPREFMREMKENRTHRTYTSIELKQSNADESRGNSYANHSKALSLDSYRHLPNNQQEKLPYFGQRPSIPNYNQYGSSSQTAPIPYYNQMPPVSHPQPYYGQMSQNYNQGSQSKMYNSWNIPHPYCYNPSMEISNTPFFGDSRFNYEGSQRMSHFSINNMS